MASGRGWNRLPGRILSWCVRRDGSTAAVLQLGKYSATTWLAQQLDLHVGKLIAVIDGQRHRRRSTGVRTQTGNPERSSQVRVIAAYDRPTLLGDRQTRRFIPRIRHTRGQYATSGITKPGLEQFAHPAAEIVIDGMAVADL